MAENSKNMSLTLFVPGLMWFEDSRYRELVRQLPQQQRRLPVLELMISRSEKSRINATSFESALFELFHLEKPDSGDYPIGALSYYLHSGEISRRWYMRADPVYMQPNRDHLLLLGNDMIDISTQDAEQLVGDINKTYFDTPWEIKMLSARHWVLEMDQAPNIQTHSLANVTGRNINDYLPYGDDATGWHALLNELQMLLHSHAVNRDREMRGLPTVNSVWFWGAGQLPRVDGDNKQQDFVQCWSQHPTVLALARYCGIPRVDLPEDGDAWLKYAITPGNHLLMLDDLNVPVSLVDPYQWWQSLLMIEQQWLQPLLSALQNGDLAKLCVISDSGQRLNLTPALSKRWWKRSKALV